MKCNLLIPTASENQEYRDLICCKSGVGLGHGLIGCGQRPLSIEEREEIDLAAFPQGSAEAGLSGDARGRARPIGVIKLEPERYVQRKTDRCR